MNSLTSHPALQLTHETAITISDPDVVAKEAADEAEWQEQHDRDKAISTICSLCLRGCGASLEYDRISSSPAEPYPFRRWADEEKSVAGMPDQSASR